MARHSDDEFSNSSDEQSRDLTAQFWGRSPAWSTTGRLRRTRRNGDHTAPVARTRRHGDRTGQIPLVPAVAIEEPLIDPYDFGFDEVGYGPAPGIAGRHVDTNGPTRVGGHGEAKPTPTPKPRPVELEERQVGRTGDPVSSLAERLGLGAVDPLLLRLGAIVMIGVLLVPVAMGLRPDTSSPSVRIEASAAPPIELTTPGEVPVGGEGAPNPATGSAIDSPTAALQSSDEPATAPTTSPPAVEAADATDQPVTTAGVGDVAEAAGDSELDVAEKAGEFDVVETVQTSRATAQPEGGAAAAAEPETGVAPVCQLSYTVAAGDYWIRIAGSAGITLAKLLQANQATIQTPLHPRDDVCLPDGATVPAPPTVPTTAPPTTRPATPPDTSPPTTAAPAAPATTPPVVTAPPAPGTIEEIIREVWPDDLEDRGLEIAWRESGYRPTVQNWCCYGLFQIHWNAHRSWLDDLGITSPTQLLDARTNTRVAHALYQRSGGWGPWGG